MGTNVNAIQYALEILNALKPSVPAPLTNAYESSITALTRMSQQNRNPSVAEWTSLKALITPPKPEPVVAAAPVATIKSVAAGTPITLSSLPKGITYVDKVNGLIAADPVVFNNPDLKGQLFAALPLLPLLDPKSQAAWTIVRNNADTSFPGTIHPRVIPVIPNPNGGDPPWVEAQAGPDGKVPWLDNAWTGGYAYDTWDKLATRLNIFRLPTYVPPTGFV